MDLFEDYELVVEFRAGKMKMEGKMVYADPRKGLLSVYRNPGGIINFIWRNRLNFKVEDDLIVFPNEAEFKKVPQCPTGRVFLLKFIALKQKYFYWMQEPKDDDDEYIETLINYILTHPPQSFLDFLRSINGIVPDEEDL
ncbi:hypothetical protein O3M35_007450 [Rhynocoris fuscipes]|uniref:Proteasomal ubiquitin receptor ADRM1 homolog n=1 Tax=Rhynocoris fuscipes TaxID=488301 RepID=A0AAW1DAW2_9HEMI